MKKIYLMFISLIVIAFTGCGNGLDSSADVQYAALGASDATGIGASPITHGYVYLITDGIEEAGKSVNQMNYGIPDIEIGGIRDVELAGLDAGFKPDVVTRLRVGSVSSLWTLLSFHRQLRSKLLSLSE